MFRREYKKLGIKILEIYYGKDNLELKKENYDIVKYYQSTLDYKNLLNEFYTIFINLRLSKEEILNQMSKNTKYEIKRNIERDKVEYEVLEEPSDEDIQEFFKYYILFEKNKGFKSRINEFKESFLELKKQMIFTKVMYEKEVLVWHVYFVDEERARLKCSVSLRNEMDSEKMKLIGRSNRGLHYNDILYFKQIGKMIYDLGGIDKVSLLKEKININKFKNGFGGEEVLEYEGNIGITLKGKLVLYLLNLYRRVR